VQNPARDGYRVPRCQGRPTSCDPHPDVLSPRERSPASSESESRPAPSTFHIVHNGARGLSALAARKGHRLEAPVQGDGKARAYSSRCSGALLRGAAPGCDVVAACVTCCQRVVRRHAQSGSGRCRSSAGGPIAHGSRPEPLAPLAGPRAHPSRRPSRALAAGAEFQ
jgi:hypothetical protein